MNWQRIPFSDNVHHFLTLQTIFLQTTKMENKGVDCKKTSDTLCVFGYIVTILDRLWGFLVDWEVLGCLVAAAEQKFWVGCNEKWDAKKCLVQKWVTKNALRKMRCFLWGWWKMDCRIGILQPIFLTSHFWLHPKKNKAFFFTIYPLSWQSTRFRDIAHHFSWHCTSINRLHFFTL